MVASNREQFLLHWLQADETSLVAHLVFSRPPIETWSRTTLNSIPSITSCCLKDKPCAYYCDPVLRAGKERVEKEEGQICVCMCVRRWWQGIAYFSYPTLALSLCGSNWATLTTPSPVSFFLFFMFIDQMVAYRSRQTLNAAKAMLE